MSFISVVITGDLVSVMADRCDSILDTETGKKYFGVGTIKKLYPVGKHGFFAMCGNYTIGMKFLKDSGFINNFSENGVIKDNGELEHWLNKNSYLFNSGPSESDYNFTLFFGGLTKDNQVCAYSLFSGDPQLIIRKPKQGCYTFYFGGKKVCDNIPTEEKFKLLMRRFDGTKTSAQDIQHELNKWVSNYDPSVGEETDGYVTVRPGYPYRV